MQKVMLYTTAVDENGNITHINEAEKGKSYYCSKCKTELILRKSGNTGKGSKRPHFAHNNLTSNCTPEGVLHYSFKKLLIDLLNRFKTDKTALLVNWTCKVCSIDYARKPFKMNLLAKVNSIEEEYYLKVCRPDIAMLDKERNVIAVIEIVVTHEPGENAINFYKENGITLIQLNLTSEEDIHKLEEKITNPDIVNFCINPNCESIENHMVMRKLQVGMARCSSCGQHVSTFQLINSSVFGDMITPFLTEDELLQIESKGVVFKMKDNTELGIKYPLIDCQNCELRRRMSRSRYNRRRW